MKKKPAKKKLTPQVRQPERSEISPDVKEISHCARHDVQQTWIQYPLSYLYPLIPVKFCLPLKPALFIQACIAFVGMIITVLLWKLLSAFYYESFGSIDCRNQLKLNNSLYDQILQSFKKYETEMIAKICGDYHLYHASYEFLNCDRQLKSNSTTMLSKLCIDLVRHGSLYAYDPSLFQSYTYGVTIPLDLLACVGMQSHTEALYAHFPSSYTIEGEVYSHATSFDVFLIQRFFCILAGIVCWLSFFFKATQEIFHIEIIKTRQKIVNACIYLFEMAIFLYGFDILTGLLGISDYDSNDFVKKTLAIRTCVSACNAGFSEEFVIDNVTQTFHIPEQTPPACDKIGDRIATGISLLATSMSFFGQSCVSRKNKNSQAAEFNYLTHSPQAPSSSGLHGLG